MVEKLVAELKRIKRDNSQIRFGLDEDVQLIFFSEFLDGKSANLGEDLNRQLTSYKESVYSNLLKHGRTWSTDHEAIFNTVLQERFLMANIIQNANLEIERAKSISDQRAEAFRKIKAAHDSLQAQYGGLDKQIAELTMEMKGDAKWAGWVTRINDSFSGFRNILTTQLVSLTIDEPIKELGEIHGSDSNFLRLQSAFRALEKENEVLRERYIKWQVDQPNPHLLEDRDRLIGSLRDQILNLNGQISSLKGKETVSVNVTGNTQEYEIKIRTLNSRIQELESQLRTQKVDFEGQIRTKNNYIQELEERLNKLGQSGVTAAQSQGGTTPYGATSSATDRMSSSRHSSSSGQNVTGQTTTSTYQSATQGGNTTTSYSSSSYQAGGSSSGTGLSGSGSGSGTYQSSSYNRTSGVSGTSGTSGLSGTSYGASGMSSSGTYGSGTGLSSSGTYGATGTTGTTSGATYTSGTSGTTSGATYTSSSGRSYGTSGQYTSSTTGATGTSGTSNLSGSGYQSYYARKDGKQ